MWYFRSCSKIISWYKKSFVLWNARFSAMIFRVKCALFTTQWQGFGVFFEPHSPGKAAGFPKAYLCASCLVPLQGIKDTGAIQLAALSVMQGEEQCCNGCVVLAALRNQSCVYLFAGCRVCFQNREWFSSPRLLVQSFEICPVASEGEGLSSGEVNKGQACALCKLFHWCSICMSKRCQNYLPT